MKKVIGIAIVVLYYVGVFAAVVWMLGIIRGLLTIASAIVLTILLDYAFRLIKDEK